MQKIFDQKIINKYLDNKIYRLYFSNKYDNDVNLIKCFKNEIIIHEGDEIDALYFLIKGKCRVTSTSPKGKLIVINTIIAPDLVGEIEFISNDDSFLVETIEESILIVLPFNKCKDQLLKDNNFLFHLCELLSYKERSQAIRLSQISSVPLKNRLALFLIENQTNNIINLKKTIIAESLGVSYRHLEKVMNDFVNEKILKKDKLIYTIINHKKIMNLVDELKLF